MKNFAYIIFFLFFAACVGKNNPPSDIIQKDSMKSVMWDMIQADQYAKLFLAKDSSKINVKEETIKLYQQVFQIHHITKNDFEKSYQYYLAHQDLYKVIFDSLAVQNMRQQHQPVILPPLKRSLNGPIKNPAKPPQ
jgi:hypothetical protein